MKQEFEPVVCDAIVLAAGEGQRLQQGRPKALVELGGRPLFLWCLETMRAEPRVERIILVAPPQADAREAIARALADMDRDRVRPLVDLTIEGGVRRQDSVMEGLRTLARLGAEEERIVLVHDAARPFVSSALVRRCLGAMSASDEGDLERQERLPGLAHAVWGVGPAGAVPGLPVRETLKLVRDDRIVWTQPREHLYAVQTPQAFRLGVLEMAHRRALEVGYHATDDAGLLEWQGVPVRLVAGDELNLKVTYPADLRLAEQLAPLHESAS